RVGGDAEDGPVRESERDRGIGVVADERELDGAIGHAGDADPGRYVVVIGGEPIGEAGAVVDVGRADGDRSGKCHVPHDTAPVRDAHGGCGANASARGAGATLVVDVEGDGQQ